MAALCTALSLTLALVPSLIYVLFALEQGESIDVIARRAAVMFLGLAVLALLGRGVTDPLAQRAIAAGFSILLIGLAILGTVEFARGAVGAGTTDRSTELLEHLSVRVTVANVRGPRRPLGPEVVRRLACWR